MERKTILVDARMVKREGHGIGNYVLDLAGALATTDLPLEYLVAEDCPEDSPLRTLPHHISKVPFLHRLEPWRLSAEIAGRAPALFHSTSFMSLWRCPVPHLQTVHDLNHLEFGSLAQKLYYRQLLLPSLKKARTVIAASESAREELSAWLKQHKAERSIELARNSIPEPAAEEPGTLERFGLKPGAYFFCLSNPKPHKNVALLEVAHGVAFRQGPTLPLVVNIPGPAQPGILRVKDLSPGAITALYRGAHTYFFPSLYEGFGRSPLEAILCGTRPVASDIPPHRETLQGVDEALLLDPRLAAPWAEAFLRLSKEPKRPVSAETKNRIREEFSVKKLGEAMERIYRKALG